MKWWIPKTLGKVRIPLPLQKDDWAINRDRIDKIIKKALEKSGNHLRETAIRMEQEAERQRVVRQLLEAEATRYWRGAFTGILFNAEGTKSVCVICGNHTKIQSKENIFTSRCDKCCLYGYENNITKGGKSWDRIGFVVMYFDWDIERRPGAETEYQKRAQLRRQVINETVRMYNNPECRPFIEAMVAAPLDEAPRRIFADWLDEHDGLYPLNQKGIREMYPNE